MPNVGLVLKEEIARLAKKEARAILAPSSERFSELKSHVSELRRKVAVLEAKLAKIEKKSGSPNGIKLPKPEELEKLRLGPSNIAKLRAKLDLSRGEMASLIDVSQNSIFLWEKGEAKPREAAKAKIVALRGLGKRKIRKLLEERAKSKVAQEPAAAPAQDASAS